MLNDDFLFRLLSPDRLTHITDVGQLKHLCLLMHHCYGSIDLSGRCLELLEQRGVISNNVARYVDYLNSKHQG